MLLRRVFTFMKIIYYWGVHAFEKGVHDFEKGFTFLENGVQFYKNNIIFMLLGGVHTFEKGVHFLERGVHAFEKKNKEFTFMKILNNIGEGFTLLRSGFTFSKKGVFKFIKTL